MTNKEDEYKDKDFDPFNWEFGDFFEDMNVQFRKMKNFMNKILRDSFEGEEHYSEGSNPYIYGWSLRMGPDGVPHFEEFGNVTKPQKITEGLREPLTDLIEEEDKIFVTSELPGVDEKNINVELISDSVLKIESDSETYKYYKEIDLPSKVDGDLSKANYNNGILDIELIKKKRSDTGTKIKIGK